MVELGESAVKQPARRESVIWILDPSGEDSIPLTPICPEAGLFRRPEGTYCDESGKPYSTSALAILCELGAIGD